MEEVHVLFSTKRLEELGEGDWELAHYYSSVVPRAGERLHLFDHANFQYGAVTGPLLDSVKVRVVELEWQFAIASNQEAKESAVTLFVEPWDDSQVALLGQWEQRVIDSVQGE